MGGKVVHIFKSLIHDYNILLILVKVAVKYILGFHCPFLHGIQSIVLPHLLCRLKKGSKVHLNT